MAIVDIIVESDADFYHIFHYRSVDEGGGVSDIDMTGMSLRMMLRRRPEDVTALLKLSTAPDDGIVITDATQGEFTVLITQAQLEALPLGEYVHSLISTLGPSQFKIWNGSLSLSAGPSR